METYSRTCRRMSLNMFPLVTRSYYGNQKWDICRNKCDAVKILTCFLCANGEFLTGLAFAYRIVGVHADAVDRGGVQVHYVRLIVGGGDVSSGMLQLPGIWERINEYWLIQFAIIFSLSPFMAYIWECRELQMHLSQEPLSMRREFTGVRHDMTISQGNMLVHVACNLLVSYVFCIMFLQCSLYFEVDCQYHYI